MQGFARSHADWCDLQCVVCCGVLESWGSLPAIDGKARIRRWYCLRLKLCTVNLNRIGRWCSRRLRASLTLTDVNI